MNAGLIFALVCALLAIVYGLWQSARILRLPAGNERMRWVDRWTETERLPLAVRLAGDGNAWPDLVVRMQIDAGGRCGAEGNEETVGCGA